MLWYAGLKRLQLPGSNSGVNQATVPKYGEVKAEVLPADAGEVFGQCQEEKIRMSKLNNRMCRGSAKKPPTNGGGTFGRCVKLGERMSGRERMDAPQERGHVLKEDPGPRRMEFAIWCYPISREWKMVDWEVEDVQL